MAETRIHNVTGRYTSVWGKSVERNMQQIAAQLEALWTYVEGIALLAL